jgi:multiple sugar transport system substrate-binding protein
MPSGIKGVTMRVSMFWRRILVIQAILLAAGGLVFAGGTKESSGGKERITFLTTDAVNFRGQLEDFIKEFNENNPQYEVIPNFSPDLGSLFVTGMQSDKAYDITFIWSNAIVSYLGSNKLAAIPESFLQKHRESMFDYSFATLSDKTGVYGVPYNFFPTWGQIMINDDLWSAAGVDPRTAKTWDEFMQLCQKVTKFDSSGKMIQAGFSYQRDEDLFFINRILQLGGIPFNPDGSAAFDNSIGKQALQYYLDIYNKWKVDDLQFGETIDSFKRGTVAAMNGMPWFAAILDKDTPNLKYSFIPAPPINDRPGYWGLFQVWAHAVSKKAENKQGVWAFLDYIVQPAQMTRWALFSGELPAVKAAANDPRVRADKILAPFVGDMQYGISKDIALWASQDVMDAIVDMMRSTALRQVTIDAGLTKGADEVTRLTRQR